MFELPLPLIAVGLSVIAIIVSCISVYWSYRTFHLLPKRATVQRYARSIWRISKNAPKETSQTEFNNALNEAKLVFGGNKDVMGSIATLASSLSQAEDHDKLIRLMAKAVGFKTKHWPDRHFENVFVSNNNQ